MSVAIYLLEPFWIKIEMASALFDDLDNFCQQHKVDLNCRIKLQTLAHLVAFVNRDEDPRPQSTKFKIKRFLEGEAAKSESVKNHFFADRGEVDPCLIPLVLSYFCDVTVTEEAVAEFLQSRARRLACEDNRHKRLLKRRLDDRDVADRHRSQIGLASSSLAMVPAASGKNVGLDERLRQWEGYSDADLKLVLCRVEDEKSVHEQSIKALTKSRSYYQEK